MSVSILRPISELSTVNDAYRRRAGLILGLALGLAYGVASQGINRIAMPGVPLYQPPLGPVGNAALWTVVGAVLGAVTAWPAGGVGGAFLGAGLGAAAVVLVNLLAARLSSKVLPALVIGGLLMLLSFLGLFVPLLGVFRWAVGREEEAHRAAERLLSKRIGRAVVPFVLGLVVVGIAATTLVPADARAILLRMNALIQAGQGAAGAPDALRDPEVGDFSAHGRVAYTLEWTRTDLNRFRIPRPLARFDEHSVAVARFADGWVLACLFVAPDWEPTCKGY